jgi:hypothetical protein
MAIKFPFENVWPIPLGDDSKLDAADLEKFGSQVAQMADGRIFTDIFPLKQWTRTSVGPSTNASGLTVYDPKSRRWLTFGFSSSTAKVFWTISGAVWRDLGSTGLTSILAFTGGAAASPDGVIVVGVYPSVASTAKLRESSDGGATWVSRNVGAFDSSGIGAVTYSASLGLWICSPGKPAIGDPNSGGIYTSQDRVTWTLRAAYSQPFQQFIVREADPSGKYGPMILALSPMNLPSGAPKPYAFSTDGVHWQFAEFGPSGVDIFGAGRGSWNYGNEQFILPGTTGVFTSRTGLGGSWTKISDETGIAGIASWGRAFLRTDGRASLDARFWFPVLELATNTNAIHSVEGIGVCVTRADGQNDRALSFLVGE